MSTVYDHRRERVRSLKAKFKNNADFAAAIGREPSQISRVIGKNPRGNVGNDLARHIEREFGLPIGLLDRPLETNESTAKLENASKSDYSFRLKTAIEYAGFSVNRLKEVSETVELSPLVLGQYIAGELMPSLEVSIALAETFQVNAIWLIQGAGDMELSPSPLYRKLTDNERSILLKEAVKVRNQFFHNDGKIVDEKIDPYLLISILVEYTTRQLSANEIITILAESLRNEIYTRADTEQILEFWKKRITTALDVPSSELSHITLRDALTG